MWNLYKIIFRGRVQRVRYKRYMSNLAQELGLVEYIRNLEDKSINIFMCSKSDKLIEFFERIKELSESAKVREIVQKEYSVNPELKYFEIAWEIMGKNYEGF